MLKRVLVTGCSSGFGRLLAEHLAHAGHSVYATMRDSRGKNSDAANYLRDLAAANNVTLRVHDLDVSSCESVGIASEAILHDGGPPDVIINNAGEMYAGITETFTPAEFNSQLDVNLVGIHRVCRAFLPAMRECRSGLIINMSSVSGRFSGPFFALYHASKWALEGYSLSLRAELASSGVDVVVVEPGPFRTELLSTYRKPQDIALRARSYPPAVHHSFNRLMQGFNSILDDPGSPNDPMLVVERVGSLLSMRAGTRPFRTVVGVDFGVIKRNAAATPFDEALLRDFGLTSFATIPSE